MAKIYLCDGVTENLAVNVELTEIENDLAAAARLAIARLHCLIAQEPVSSSVVDTRLADLHRMVAQFRNFATKRDEVADLLNSEDTESGTPELRPGWTLVEALRDQKGDTK